MRFLLCLLLSLSVLASSCSTSRQTRYLQDTSPQTAGDSPVSVSATVSVIQPDDILAINVTSISSIASERDDLVALFRQGGTPFSVAATQGAGQNSGSAGGFLVDAGGNIDYPVIGKLAVGGLTIPQAKTLLSQRLKDYVKSPIVEVRIVNYKVTVLGEVNRPGVVLAPNHRINILEALAAAGDIPISGRRDNVQVVREGPNGQREFARLDLSSRDVFRSPYFFLKQNDMVIVEASRVRRSENSDFVRIYLPIITAAISSFAIIYSVTRINRQQ